MPFIFVSQLTFAIIPPASGARIINQRSNRHNKINGAIRRHFGKQMSIETKLRIRNITAKAALKFGSEAWLLKKREEQRLEAAQMKCLRYLLGITKLDKEKNQCITGKNGSTEHSTGNKTVPEKKWLQHVQRMDTNRIPKQALQYKPKGRRTLDDQGRDGGTNFILRIKEQETHRTLHEHDDDDDDDDDD